MLHAHYCKGGLRRSFGLMQSILAFDFGGEEFIDRLLQWGDLIGSYDKLQSPGEEMPDKINHTVLMMQIPQQLK